MSKVKIGSGTIKWCNSRKAKPTKYGPKYECSIVVTPEYAKQFNDSYVQALNDAKAKEAAEFGEQYVNAFKVKFPFYEETDADGNKTGMWIAKTTRQGVTKGGKENPPQVVDENKQPVDASVEVANGSEGYIVVEARPWAFTISKENGSKTLSMPLWLELIQVTKLIKYGERQNPLDLL